MPKTIVFIQEPPYNNMWLMVVLIWIQVGFAMVIFSSAIKAVPTEFTEAARIDGATESQVFWRITLPQIAPTVGVVVTTLIVAVHEGLRHRRTSRPAGSSPPGHRQPDDPDAVLATATSGSAPRCATLLFIVGAAR